MAEILIKVQTNDINIELQGENEIVERIFNDLRKNGIGMIEEKDNYNMQKEEVIKDIKESNDENNLKNKPIIKTERKGKQNLPKKYEYIELNLTKDEISNLEEFFTKSKAKSVQDQMLVLMYWYNKKEDSKNFEISFNCDLIYSLFRNIKITQTANLEQIKRNIMNRSLYLQKNKNVKDEFLLSTHGQKYVEDLIEKEIEQ